MFSIKKKIIITESIIINGFSEYYKEFSMLSLSSAKPTLNSQSQPINLTFINVLNSVEPYLHI